ncbi:LacI family DNA-binding transcriptional regulator [Corynebacterium freneyi]|uniref:LacI family transcriptional regulator n=1 Tax=Corynebacterium freneyi DNF00450 TaxID=1287475 RepID=A0A096AD87_9CORY|nr:LacI family DNA-binding transcriptional regulator [Corynebacterium freneyi]KGF18879.1 LacI family transcriptional regulator [Corynebacterium freneyi DNF00450]
MASIAAELGVSRTTVSNAYNRPDQLSPELRERILAQAEAQGYPGPDPMARSLRMRRVGAVGVLFTEQLSFAFDDPASVDFLAGLSEECGRRGDSLLVIPASSAEGESGDVRDDGSSQGPSPVGSDPRLLIRQAVVDSFVVYSVAEDDPFLRAVLERGLPTVICDQPTRVEGVPFVGIDDREAIKPAVRHVTELGHREVGVLSVRLSRRRNDGAVTAERLAGARHHVQRSRVQGALEALAEAGIDAADVPIVERHLNDPANNYDAARELLTAHPNLTAVVCTTDTQALGVLRYARDNGIRVPEDLSVTGFDGIDIARHMGVTTIIQPNRDKGRAAGAALAGGESKVILPTEFLAGRTTGVPRN